MSDTEEAVFYVDEAIHEWRGQLWAHLMTTGTQADLILFATTKLGLNRKWIQHFNTERAHFDVTVSKRLQAIKAGAVAVDGRTLVRICVMDKRAKK